METVLLSLIFIAQALIFYSIRKNNSRLEADIRTFIASIARDLNSVVSTIAVYTGQGERPLIVPPGEPGEGIPPEQLAAVDAARRKAELWRAVRASRR